jgi:hypothetical protein
MELKQTKVYVPTDVKDYIINPFQKVIFSIQQGNNKCVKYAHDISEIDKEILEEKEGYFFTKEELERVIGDAFDEGFGSTNDFDQALNHTGITKEQYIKQILK